MFKDVQEISRHFVVKFVDGTYLCQGNKATKLYRKRQRAEKALEEALSDGEVVEVSLGEVNYAEPSPLEDTSGVQDALMMIADKMGAAHRVDLYKATIITDRGYNVIRHVPLGTPRTYQPGDCYTDIDLHLQVRINH